MAGQTPRAGDGTKAGLERYLVPSVTTAPTAVSDQDGLLPGIPVPQSTNSAATVGVSGSYRPGQTGVGGLDPVIYVYVEDLGSAPVAYIPPTPPAGGWKGGLFGRIQHATAELTAVFNARGETSGAVGVPRFGVRRFYCDDPRIGAEEGGTPGTDSEIMGVDVDFREWGDPVSLVPPGATGTWQSQGAGQQLVVASDGTLRLVTLAMRTDLYFQPIQYGLTVRYFDQSTMTTWATHAVVANLTDIIPTFGTANAQTSLLSIGVAAVDNDLYIALTGYNDPGGDFGSDMQGEFWILRVSGAAGSGNIELLTDASGSGGVTSSHAAWVAVAGASLVSTTAGFLLARALATAEPHYKISMARSTDGRSWGDAPTYAATTISITGGNTIEDSAGSLPIVNPGDTVTLSGCFYTANNATFTVVSATRSAIAVGTGLLTNETVGGFGGGAVTRRVTAGVSAIEFLSDYRPLSAGIALGSTESITALRFATTTKGFAATDKGRIFYTGDGGQSWVEQDAPTRASRNAAQTAVPLRDLYCLVPDSEDDPITAFVVGDQHVVLKTVTSGARWAVWWTALTINSISHPWSVEDRATVALDHAAYMYALKDHNEDSFPAIRYMASLWQSGTAGWIAGERGVLSRVTNTEGTFGNNQQTTVQGPSGTGDYLCASEDPQSAHATLIFGGDVGVHSGNATAANRTKRFRHVASATTSPTYTYKDVADVQQGDPAIVAVKHFATGEALAVDASGAVLFYDGDWTLRAQLPGTSVTVAGLQILDTGPHTGEYDVLAFGWDGIGGLVWRSEDSGLSWISERVIGQLTTGYFPTRNAGLVVGEGLWYSDSWQDNRVAPALHALASGAVLLACANLTKARLELYRADSPTQPFLLTWTTTVPAAVLGAELGEYGSGVSLSFTVDQNGDVLLSVGQSGYVSTDDGRTWRTGDDPALALPLGRLTPTTTCPAILVTASRKLCAYGGRLWSTVVRLEDGKITNLGVFTSREWALTATQYHPIWPGVPQWVGVDDVRVIWSGTPAANDVWYIPPAYRYPARHIVVSSPSVITRTTDNAADWILDWDREAAATQAVLGYGTHWHINGGALFNTNFATASLRYSNPTYSGSSFPTSGSDYQTQQLSAIVDPAVTCTMRVGGLFYCAGKAWAPGQYAPGTRTYYIYLGTGGNLETAKILDNQSAYLVTDYSGSSTPDTITIFSDRMAVIPTLGTFSRWVRILVLPKNSSGQAIYGTRRQIGTAIIGTHSSLTTDRRRHSGMTWEPVTYTASQRSLAGAVSTETFRRPGQRWRLPYEWAQYWDRDARILPLLPRLRDPFALVFRGNDTQTVELVRLTDGPASANVLHDRWADTWELEEVV